MCRIVDNLKRALWGGLGCLVLLVAGAASAAGPVAWRAQALGVAVQATSAQELRSSILLALTDRFAADQGIDVSDAEVAAYLAEMRRFMAARGQPLPDPAMNAAVLRALRKRQSFTKPSVKRRQQVLRAVYKLETYGGEQ